MSVAVWPRRSVPSPRAVPVETRERVQSLLMEGGRVEEVAEACGVSTATVYRIRRFGTDLPSPGREPVGAKVCPHCGGSVRS